MEVIMDIPFLIRHSDFLLPCKAAIRRNQRQLQAGGSISVSLPDGGYDGHVFVTLKANNSITFGTNWANNDPSRFPARIKAAATALKDSGYVGRFEIAHTDGTLKIRQG